MAPLGRWGRCRRGRVGPGGAGFIAHLHGHVRLERSACAGLPRFRLERQALGAHSTAVRHPAQPIVYTSMCRNPGEQKAAARQQYLYMYSNTAASMVTSSSSSVMLDTKYIRYMFMCRTQINEIYIVCRDC